MQHLIIACTRKDINRTNEKNFIEFMEGHAIEALKHKIDENYFKDLVGKSILYRSVEKIIG